MVLSSCLKSGILEIFLWFWDCHSDKPLSLGRKVVEDKPIRIPTFLTFKCFCLDLVSTVYRLELKSRPRSLIDIFFSFTWEKPHETSKRLVNFGI